MCWTTRWCCCRWAKTVSFTGVLPHLSGRADSTKRLCKVTHLSLPLQEKEQPLLYMCKDSEHLVVFMTQTARSRLCNLRSLSFFFHECNEICLSGSRIHLYISPWMRLVQTVLWKNCFPEETVLTPQPGQLWIETKRGIALIGSEMHWYDCVWMFCQVWGLDALKDTENDWKSSESSAASLMYIRKNRIKRKFIHASENFCVQICKYEAIL